MSRRGEITPPPWWQQRPRNLVFLAVLLILVVLAVWLIVPIFTECGPGVARRGGECIGVSDGSVVFPSSSELGEVMGSIREENRRVEQSGEPYVSVAYLVPLVPPEGDDDLSEVLRHELQGAYLAQRKANRAEAVPLIRLLVANAGEENQQWEPVVTQLLGRVGAPEHLVAVAGLGLSLEATRQAITALTDAGMPTIAAALTADNLRAEPGEDSVRGLVRVAPTNTDEARAAAAYLKLSLGIRSALLIQDTNETDLYPSTLSSAFQAAFPDATHTLIEPAEQYDSSLPAVANTFRLMMASICQQQPDIVYFAGRDTHLEAFVELLPQRPCLDFRVNIVTGDAGAGTVNALNRQLDERRPELRAALEANVTLRYTALAHPGAWGTTPSSFSRASIGSFAQDCEGDTCFRTLFLDEPLDDGRAIMGHDAVLTAIEAIRRSVTQQEPTTDPGKVAQLLGQLRGTNAVPGASGWISFDERGNPIEKAIPILELMPDGTVAFVQLTSPSGAPFTPPSPQ